VRIAPEALAQLNTLSTALYWEAVAAHTGVQRGQGAGRDARCAIRRGVDSIKGDWKPSPRRTPAQRASAAPPRRGPATPSLEAVSNALQAAAMAMQAAEVAPTARATGGGHRRAYARRGASWRNGRP
jgi:hypothetical protein